ncbi:hypothetical protein [Subdoligranulum variabile]|uniref:Uncharacterized protein n=1 Tax=Subdoligranulum variabile DSM 15176 TaxID=411471 RepID=D1PP04_9FIRM|nr:hypothetical protein [Subdoligranulum variabile]EFB75500.1 hypothetical protein SUBVAR_06118 [Subdoligranulum variabile DSM 15176]UWP68951.1 hypothetical protein NQ490_03625 [Subdoligranulum variabile]
MKDKDSEKGAMLRRTAPSRQKQAKEYLKGQVPGVMAHYAPDAVPDPDEGWVESDETVHRLAHWREEAIY